MLGILKHCVTRLASFSGRDPRRVFWPYAGAVFLAYFLVNAVTMSLGVSRIAASGGAFDPQLMMGAISAEIVVVVLALAAAVVRRLHDAGLRGFWGLLPVPFLTFSLVAFNVLIGRFDEADQPTGLFMAVFFSNTAYMVALVTLIILLVRRTRPAGAAPA